MDRIKNYVLICLFIIAVVLGFMLWCKPPKIVREVITKEKRVAITSVVYRDTVTYRTVTVQTNGTVVTTERIVDHDVIHETTNTIEKEKEVIKYAMNDWAIGLNGSTNISLPLVPTIDSFIVYRRIIFSGYLGLGYDLRGRAVLGVLITF